MRWCWPLAPYLVAIILLHTALIVTFWPGTAMVPLFCGHDAPAHPVSDSRHTLWRRCGGRRERLQPCCFFYWRLGSLRARPGRDFRRRQSMERSAGERGPAKWRVWDWRDSQFSGVCGRGRARPAHAATIEFYANRNARPGGTACRRCSSQAGQTHRRQRSHRAFRRRRYLLLALLACAPLAAEIRSLTILHTTICTRGCRRWKTSRAASPITPPSSARARQLHRLHPVVCRRPGAGLAGFHHLPRLPVYEIANLFGFDAATLGNHEFDYGWMQVRKFIQTANYPMVTCNLVGANGSCSLSRTSSSLSTSCAWR